MPVCVSTRPEFYKIGINTVFGDFGDVEIAYDVALMSVLVLFKEDVGALEIAVQDVHAVQRVQT